MQVSISMISWIIGCVAFSFATFVWDMQEYAMGVWWYIDLVRTVLNTVPPCECLQSVPLKALSWQYATFARLGKAQRDFSALMYSGRVCGTRSFGEENEMGLSGYDMLCPNFWGNSEVTSMMVCRAKYPNKAGLIDHLPRSNEKFILLQATTNKQLARHPTYLWCRDPCCVWSFGSTNCPAKLKDARFSQRSHAHRINKGSLVCVYQACFLKSTRRPPWFSEI